MDEQHLKFENASAKLWLQRSVKQSYSNLLIIISEVCEIKGGNQRRPVKIVLGQVKVELGL